jgi:tRNA nucleotidyltransferase (CCA-adding enzyme)
MGVEEEVLARIRPSAEEEARIERVVRELLERLASTLKSRGWDAKPFLAGSVAKGTHLTGTEIDVFVAFPPDLPRADLEERGLALGTILEKGAHLYAEHPYTRGWYGGFEVEIVPCYRITDASQRMSAVDRTPLHVDYVLGHLRDGQADEIRLLKAWAEGIGVYGAEAKIRGFSGYLCELLVLKYGSFRGVLENSLTWRRGTLLELDRAAARTFEEPLVVIDPVDPNRNVASAVEVDQLATFVHAAREYLRSPSDRFFFPRPLKPLAMPRLRALAKKRGSGLVAISIPSPAVTDDVLYPQLRKAHRAFLDLLHRNSFQVFDSRFDVVAKEALFLFEFAVDSLPLVSRHEGPPVWVKNAKEFLDKWRKSPKTIAGPFIHGERWAVDVRRDGTTAPATVKAKWRTLSLGKDLEKAAKRSLRIHHGPAALRSTYADAWTRLFDKRFPWER